MVTSLVKSAVLVVPGPLAARTGGYEYDRRMAAGLRALGWTVGVRELDASFPSPTPGALAEAADALAAIPPGATVLIDGLALGAMPSVVERERARLRIVAIVHLPLADDPSLDRMMADRVAAAERRALAAARLLVVTGASTIDAIRKHGLSERPIVVIEPGTDRVPLARGSGAPLLELLAVATVNHGKGHDILIAALASIPERNWRLTCAGSLTRDRATVDRVRAAIATAGLADRVSLAGELDARALDRCYDRADVFVLATLHETYGMAVAEALARGLPIVSTTTGAIRDLVNPGRLEIAFDAARTEARDVAGILVPPGDRRALADALSRVLGDAELRARLAEGARRLRDRLPTWEEASGKMAAALERAMDA
jgi:glycosyltransferase involved in cell wall biosynthesis